MIYTVTLNPSIDYTMYVDDFKAGEINRSKKEDYRVGGKGINVSLILKELGMESKICTLKAGAVGDNIKNEIVKKGFATIFIDCEGNSRINVKLPSENETAINGSGHICDYSHIDSLCSAMGSREKDIIVLSGSVCRGLDTNVYRYIMESIRGRFVVDTTGKYLTSCLCERPFLVKPNIHELEEIFDTSIKGFNEAVYYGKSLVSMGAENVIVSMGSEGAVFVNENEEYIHRAEKIKANNTVGAGDSMVAGFIYGYSEYGNFKDAFMYSGEVSKRYLKGEI